MKSITSSVEGNVARLANWRTDVWISVKNGNAVLRKSGHAGRLSGRLYTQNTQNSTPAARTGTPSPLLRSPSRVFLECL